MEMPFIFDSRKVCQQIRKPTAEEPEIFLEVEITAPAPCNPSGSTHLQPQRKNIRKSRLKTPIEELRKRLALAPDGVINHTLDNTAQLAIDMESDN